MRSDRLKKGGSTVLITGGASGIGLALAAAMAKAGDAVVVCGRDQAKLDAACGFVPGLTAIRADVGDTASRAELVAEVSDRFPALNVLVNNAGLLHVIAVADPGFTAALELEAATNLVGPSALTAALLPLLLRQPEATVVNVTTGYVFLPSAMVPCYSATKAGMHAMTRAIRFQLRDTKVRVVEVMPPAVDTAMAGDYAGRKISTEAMAQQIQAGLRAGKDEIVVGLSRVGQIMARVAPRTGFAVMNRGEYKAKAAATT